ncbi:YciI family protein [Sphingomonas mollis]|uniref:GTP cyclohydrolase n=1 Tax=Sphingomonas mollis TaxID=2795726 RepID=A0ABS0XJR1_9SPHN|nr:YciI family protein [Sphingomonas sp. BT553]MBJ6120266.1 GTP cyclohydrolase [Sphingomonas sp. BT553]
MVARPMTPLCLVLLTYVKPLDEVDRHRAAHVRWIENYVEENVMLLAGRRDPPTGGVLLFKGEADVVSEEAAKDPFVVNGVATFEVIPFTATLAMEEIGDLLC